jgi:hypothetical protein
VSENQKTLVAAAILAAAVGVYLEMSRLAKERAGAAAPSASAVQGVTKPGVP